MPKPARPWCRFYAEAVDNQKVHDLPDRLVKPWLFLLNLATVNEPRGRLPSIIKIAFKLRVKEEKAKGILTALIERGFIDPVGQHYVMHDWEEWQQDSDLPWRQRPPKGSEGAKINRPTTARGDKKVIAEKDQEKDQEKEGEGERAPAYPFAINYAREYQRRHGGRPPPPTEHAAALALEREYGANACIQVASDYDWQKHPNYLRPILEERRNGKSSEPAHSRGRMAEVDSLTAADRAALDRLGMGRSRFILDPGGDSEGREGEHPPGAESTLEVG